MTAAPGSSPGQALRHTGQGDTPSFSLYHQVFNRAHWSAVYWPCWCRLFDAAGGSLTFVLDETLERRWGQRINKRGHYRDPLASSRKHSVSTSGLRWIVLTLVLTPPCSVGAGDSFAGRWRRIDRGGACCDFQR